MLLILSLNIIGLEMPSGNRGFTIIELLVVVGVIAVLAGLLLPAAQMVRETARRTHCANNLRQLGLATLHFESAFEYLPTSWKPSAGNNGWSAQAQVLPFAEQSNLYDQINFAKSYADPSQTIAVAGVNIPLASFRIPFLLCPSEPNDRVRNASDGSPVHYPLNYGANIGTWLVHNPATQQSGDGVFGVIERRRVAEVRDGLSNTLMFAEVKAYNPYFRNAKLPGTLALPTPAEIVASAGDFKSTSGHTEWVDGRCHQSGFTGVFPPNTEIRFELDGAQYDVDWTNIQEGISDSLITFAAITARSHHPAGVNICRADGSVSFMNEQIELIAYRALVTRAGRETISESSH